MPHRIVAKRNENDLSSVLNKEESNTSISLAREDINYAIHGGRVIGYDDAGNIVEEHEGPIWFGVPEGSTIETPENREAKKKYADRKQLMENIRDVDKTLQFIFVQGDMLAELLPETAARLVFIATYLRHGNSVPMLTQRKAVTRNDVPDLLGVSARTVCNMVTDAKGIMTFDSSGRVCLDERVLCRGTLPRQHALYHRIKINPIRNIWQTLTSNQHRYLGYVFQMLPYLNIQHNVLCWNPGETDYDLIDFMSFHEFVDLVGYNASNASRLKSACSNIQFGIEEERAALCAFVNVGRSTRVIVNPDVAYAGTTADSVRSQRRICREACRKS